MRFDDKIATVLALPEDRPDRLALKWRQLVDLLAQGVGSGEDRERAFQYLRAARSSVPAAVRRAAGESLSGLAVQADFVIYFAEDMPVIAAPVIRSARMPADQWIGALPRLGPTARALLRHRRDLPYDVTRALLAFGPSDFALEGTAEVGGTAEEKGESQISELVTRIENFRRRAATEAPPTAPFSLEFRWETGSDGMVRWVEGAPREPLIGQSIAVIAAPGQHGVDGQAAGAFEKKAPFRDARFSVAGEGPACGEWRLSGVPFFDPTRGSFLGYRGTARRPRVDETARPDDPALFGSHFPLDALRQLIHELRTPLNAIVGFAEMIEGQYMGPAATPYRDRAAQIMDQSRRLLVAVDDLDMAARIETSRLDLRDAAVDAAAILGRLHESFAGAAQARGAELELQVRPDLPFAKVEGEAVERMFARLLAATIGLAGPGELIRARIEPARHGAIQRVRLAVDRPLSISGLGERDLLDPGYSPEGDWPDAPALGLGFALRLVRNLAEAVGGSLEIDAARILLDLPALGEKEGEGKRKGGSA